MIFLSSISKDPIVISSANTIYTQLKSKAPAHIKKNIDCFEKVCSKEHEIKVMKGIEDNVNIK